MSIAILAVLASAAVAAPPSARTEPPRAHGVVLASATARVRIVRPAILRQAEGWRDPDPEAPRPQIIRREGTVSIEFE